MERLVRERATLSTTVIAQVSAVPSLSLAVTVHWPGRMPVTRPPLTLATPMSLENQLTVRPDRLSTVTVLVPPTPSEMERSDRRASG